MALNQEPIQKLSYVMCQTSASHTFGNVTACIENWLINLFPENTFKTIHVSSKAGHRQLRSTPREFLKKQRPMFIIRPRIEWEPGEIFLGGSLLTERALDQYAAWGETNLQPFMYDQNKKFAVKYQMNRDVINFDVILVWSAGMQQIDMAKYLRNAVRWNTPMFISTCLESFLPRDMMEMISKCIGIPIYDCNGSVRHFLDYLNGHSMYPITYKLMGKRNQDEFYRYYPVNLDVTLQDFQTNDGDKNGQVTTNYQISFTVRCEFNSTGFYYIFSKEIKDRSIIPAPTSDGTLVPIFTDVFVGEDYKCAPGWSLFDAPCCRLSDNVKDVLDISHILNESTKECIKYHKEHGIPTSLFIDFRVRKQGELIHPGDDFDVDLDNMTITFYHGSTFYTYKVLIYLNIGYINNLVKDIFNLE